MRTSVYEDHRWYRKSADNALWRDEKYEGGEAGGRGGRTAKLRRAWEFSFCALLA